LLETLALIAYRQPITRGEIEEIRGVTVSSNIMRTLHERNWIRVLGHREVPGRPEILGTTKEFLDYFGLKGLDELPSLAELKDVETMGVQLEFNTGEAPATTEANAAEAAGEPVQTIEVTSEAVEAAAESVEAPAAEVETADTEAQAEAVDTQEPQSEPAEETQT
jgi:segregation and condensation protein B